MVLFKNIHEFYLFYSFIIVIFTSEAAKINTMCNGYITQACNGRLSSLRRLRRNDLRSILTVNLTKEEQKDFHVSVVGGRLSKPKEYPHMALIGFGKKPEVKWLCGGSLISENFVLSAAHCLASDQGNPTWIRLGELNLARVKNNARAVDYHIIQVIVHPEYKHRILYNDIALFKFQSLSSFSDYIRPICLNVFKGIPNQKFIAVGWGSTGYGEMNSPELLSVDLDLQSSVKCNSLYTGNRLPNGFNDDSMLCVGYAPGGKDTCQGDSGGPLQISNYKAGCSTVPIYTQIGIISFGESCALPDTPAVYTRVSYFIPWIEKIVWN